MKNRVKSVLDTHHQTKLLPERVGNAHSMLFVVLTMMLLSACNVTKHLDTNKGERLVTQNVIKLKNTQNLNFSKRQNLQLSLAELVRQKPNTRVLGRGPRAKLWLYYRYENRNSKFARWVKNNLAEEPSIYDPAQTLLSTRNIINDLYKKGYFNATCTAETQKKKRFGVKTTYSVDMGNQFKVNNIRFFSKDSLLNEAIQLSTKETLLKPKLPISEENINAEKARVTYEIRNRGYANFTPNYVDFSADTTTGNVTVELLRVQDTIAHKTYFINNITILVGVVPEVSYMRRDTTINGIYYATSEPEFQVYPTRLYESITLRPGWPYRQVDFDKTSRNLNALGVFRFVAIRPVQDSLNPNKINVDIKLTPNQRTSISGDFGLSYSDANSGIARSLVGISPSGSFRNRNLLGGAEIFSSNVDYAIELNPSTSVNKIFSQEIGFNNQIVFPRYFDYLGMWNLARKMKLGNRRLVSNRFYQQLKTDGTTRFAINYNYQQVFQFYKINSASLVYGYNIRVDNTRQYAVDHIGIDILSTTPEEKFIILTERNKFLEQSFRDQLFTGLLIRSINFWYNGKPNSSGERLTFRAGSDFSGLEIFALNKAYNRIFDQSGAWRAGNILDFAKYIRLDLDAIYTRNFRRQIEAAARLATGVTYAFDGAEAPYVKQFSIGGPSSIRAWRIRELGPGGFFDPEAEQPFFQTGDFRLEVNGELRFPLFWWVKGAVFIDAGNVWILQKDIGRPGAQLKADSWKNIAVGTGLGIRLDFEYAILRFDFGLPLRNPYATADKYWIPNRISGMKLSSFSPNLAVGLPF